MSERSIFLSALEISEESARRAYLDEACRENAQLRQEIESLLQSYAQAGTFLESPAAGIPIVADAGACESEEDDRAAQNSATLAALRPLLQPTSKPDSLGKLGHYEIESVLGQGSFGIVLKAFDEKLHRLVAIKVMPPALAVTSAPRKRFLREARSAAAIRHENIVAIHAVEEQPLPYLVMEYVPGVTLQEWLDQHGPLDVGDVLRIGQQIAAGLAAAHAHGLIHRDIKPANILLESGIEPRAKITDFGLARTADDASLTQSGIIAGTPLYMSPEQARGLALDPRSDLFSLGSVLYTMICGRPPFRAPNTIAVLKRLCEETPRSMTEIIPETPAWLCQLIARLHAKEPAERMGSAREVADLLGQYLAYRQEPERVAAPVLPSEPVAEAPVFEIVPELIWPGRGLIATGCLNLFGLLAVLPEVITVLRLRASWLTFDVTPLALPLLIGVPAIIVLLGGLKLQRAESFVWCIVASLLAVVSLPGALIGLPTGLWSLYLLTRPEIRAKFQSTAPRRKSRAWPSSLSIGLLGGLLVFWVQRGAYPDRLVNGSIALACACVMLVCWVVERWLLEARAERAAQVVAGILTAAALLSAGNAWLAWETPDPRFSQVRQQQELATRLEEGRARAGTHTLPASEVFLSRMIPAPQPDVDVMPLLLPSSRVDGLPDGPAEALSPQNVTAAGLSWTPLFNGRDLTGWKTWPEAPGNWRVENGVLIGSERPGYLFTERADFTDFELQAEVSISHGGDGGIVARTPFVLGRMEGLPGYELQLQSGTPLIEGWTTGAIGSSDPVHGWRLRVPSPRTTTPDEWFMVRLRLHKNEVETFVNGERIAWYIDPDRLSSSGHIALQLSGEKSRIAFRRIDIREATPTTPPLPVTPGLPMTPEQVKERTPEEPIKE